jgi:outer membrane receptor for ferric coprogen and ferric-rhodotorulic acid
MVEAVRKTPQIVNVKDREQMNRQPLTTIGNALQDTLAR